jgi:gliding motility-associated-like protein
MIQGIFRVVVVLVGSLGVLWRVAGIAAGQVAITPATNAGQAAGLVANTFQGNGVTISSPSFQGATGSGSFGNPSAIGRFKITNNSPAIGFTDGIIMSTGNVLGTVGIPGANSPCSQSLSINVASRNLNQPGLPLLNSILPAGTQTNDAAVLTFNFSAGADTVEFRYIFMSEEYNEYVDAGFNDVFGFFVSGPNPSGGVYTNRNIALLPGTLTPVSINNVNNGVAPSGTAPTGPGSFPQFFRNNDPCFFSNLVFDGLTRVLTAKLAVVPCATYTLQLAIADAGDATFDSAVMLQAFSFTANSLEKTIVSSQGGSVNTEVITAEGCAQPTQIRFKRVGNISQPITIPFSFLGTATPNIDYTVSPETLSFAANQAEQIISIQPLADAVADNNETVWLRFQPPNSCGLFDTLKIRIVEPSPIQGTSFQKLFEVCSGTPVSVSSTGSGGSGTFAYSWNAGSPGGPQLSTQPSFSPPTTASGTYYLTISDPVCQFAPYRDSVRVRVLDAPPLNVTVPQNVQICGNQSTPLTAEITGGSPNPQIQWSSGQTTASISLPPNTNTTLTLTVTDACTTIVRTVVITSSNIQLTVQQTQPPCGGVNSGSITVTATGGLTPYEFALNAGPFGSTNVFTGLAGGQTYTVRVRDAVGCEVTQAVQLGNAQVLTASVSGIQNPACNGQATGSFAVSATGGTPPYQYQLNNGNFGSTNVFNNLVAGNYTFTVRDANLCTTSQTVTLTQPGALVLAPPTTTNVACAGQSTGSITTSASGGVSPYAFSLNAGAEQATGSFGNLAAGSYVVRVRDANNCTQTTTVSVGQPASAVGFASQSVGNVLCGGQNTGSITVAGSGGTPGYSYRLNNGNFQTSGQFSGLVAGTYTVTVRDANQCTATTSLVVSAPPVLTVSIGSSQGAGCAGGTGSFTATGGGGVPPYEYRLNAGSFQSSGSFGNLAAGTYVVTVRDANSCTVTQTVTISQPTSLVLAPPVVTDVACSGLANGAVSATATGGTPPYAFRLNQGAEQASGTFTSLAAGSYVVQVRDANGCTQSATVVVSQPTPLAVANSTQANILCAGQATGSISATGSGGTPPYQYRLNNGSFQTSGTFTGLTVGTYTLTVRDNNTCIATQSFTLTQPTPLVLTSLGSQHIACGGQATGSLAVQASSGAAPYQYQLNGGTAQGSGVFANLPAGNYVVTATDANGCTQSLTILLTEPPALSLTLTPTNVVCTGFANGSIASTVTGGTGGYGYLWSPGGQTTSALSGLSPGNYTLRVTDATGCTATATTTITEPSAITSVVRSQSTIACFGGAGAISIRFEGSVPFNLANFSVSPANTSCQPTFPFGNSNLVADYTCTALPAGTYVFTAVDINGCTHSRTVTLTQPPALSLQVTATTSPTCALPASGTVSFAVSGGTGQRVFRVNGTVVTPVGSTITGLAAGGYTLSVQDENGCTTSQAFTIAPPFTDLNLGIEEVNQPLCFGQANGSLRGLPGGGNPPYQYALNGGGFQANPVFGGLNAGVYQMQVRDALQCVATATYTLNQPSPLTLALVQQTNISCFGGTNGAFTVQGGGGTPPYAYQSGTANFVPTGQFTGLSAGTYVVTIRDANACTQTLTVTLTQPQPLQNQFSAKNISCRDGADGSLTSTVSGGTPPYGYLWSTGETTPGISNLTVGTYSLTITDANGCVLTQSATLTQPATPLALSTTQQNLACHGQPTGTINLTVSGGNPPYVYQWSNGQTTEDLANLPAGSYTVSVTDANGCVRTLGTTLTQPTPLALTGTSTAVVCNGQSNGTASLTPSGGTLPYSIVWNTGSTAFTLTNLPAGTYTATVTDGNACTATGSVVVSQPTPLQLSHTRQNVSCFGQTDGSINLVVTGATPPYTYQWSNGQTTEDLSGLGAGTYGVQVRDANNCLASTTITITQPALLTASTTGTSIACNGQATGTIQTLVSGGTASYTYAWNPAGPATPTRTNLVAGTYTVTITDAQGCTTVATRTLTQPSAISISLQAQNVLCNGQSTGSIATTISGGTPPYTYAWSTGSSSVNLANLSAGGYTVTVTDANNCQQTASVTLTEPPVLSSTINMLPVRCHGEFSGGATVVPVGGVPPYVYLWSTGATGPSLVNIGAGSYSVRVTDANGCTTSTSTVVTQPAPLVAVLDSVRNIPCKGEINGVLAVSGQGGTGPYTYRLGASGIVQTTGVFSGLPVGTYTILLEDANGCTTTLTRTLTEPAKTLTLDSISVKEVTCAGDRDGSVVVHASGGTPPYTYSFDGGTDFIAFGGLVGLGGGVYQVLVRDANGCLTENRSVPLREPLPLTATQTLRNISCNGGSDGQIIITPTGGTPPYRYALEGLTTFQTSPAFTGLPIGSYRIRVEDARGCSFLGTPFLLTQPDAVVLALVGIQNPICHATLTGQATVQASGGTPPYLYRWSHDAGLILPTDNNLLAGDYSVQAIDANGCLSPTVSFTLVSPPEVQAGSDRILCYTGTLNGQQTQLLGLPDGGRWTGLGVDSLGVFRPALVGYGTTTISYTVGSCVDSFQIRVAGADLGPLPELICARDSRVTLNPQPPGGRLLVNGVPQPDNTFSPAEISADTARLRYETLGGCAQEILLTLAPAPQIRALILPIPVNDTIRLTMPGARLIARDQSTGTDRGSWALPNDTLRFVVSPADTTHSASLFARTLRASGTYTLTHVAENDLGCTDSRTYIIIVEDRSTIDIPTAFSPNGDGLNDLFTFRGIEYEGFTFTVFSRWAGKIRTWNITGDVFSWDGTLETGERVPEGVYFYRFDGRKLDGTRVEKVGDITILY